MKQKLGAGIIGCGGIGWIHAQAFSKTPLTNLVAVADVVEERAKGLIQKYNAKAWYTNYEEMLQRRDIHVVSVCTPPWLHKQMVLEAVEAGKHVLCEKPMALSLDEAEEMVNGAKKAGVKLAIDFHNRYLPAHQKAKKLLDEGLIGRLFQIRCRLGYPFLESAYLQNLSHMKDWLFIAEKSGGGVLMDIGSHWIDLARFFVGNDVKSVSALIGTVSRSIKVDDNIMILCEFENGVQGVIDVSWTQRGGFWFIELYGLDGTMICNGPQPIMIYTEKKDEPHLLRKAWIYPRLEPAEEPHERLIREFVEAIENCTEPPVSGEDGKKAQEIIKAAYESYKTKRIIQLPLKG